MRSPWSVAFALAWCLASGAAPACTALVTESHARARPHARPLVGRALAIRGGSALTSTLERAELSWRERVEATESANHLKFKLVLEAGYGATLQVGVGHATHCMLVLGPPPCHPCSRPMRQSWPPRAPHAASWYRPAAATPRPPLPCPPKLAAELQRRGVSGAWLEVDYVMAGILTAVAGKTYAAYRVAPTKAVEGSDEPGGGGGGGGGGGKGRGVPRWIATAPTNAFQLGQYTLAQRLGAFVAPAPRLFTSGCACGLAGYSFAALLSQLRALAGAGPSLAPAVPILPATLYTGIFLVIVSNLSLQFLQGVIEVRFATYTRQRRSSPSQLPPAGHAPHSIIPPPAHPDLACRRG